MVRTYLRAQILLNNGASTIDCTIKNISMDGAKIAIVNSVAVPSEFDLVIPQRGRTYRAKVIWRAAGSIDVDFVKEGDTSDDEQATIQRLEGEVLKLRASVARLAKRLEDIGQVVDSSV